MKPEAAFEIFFKRSAVLVGAAKKMICIVPERRKAEAVKAALQGPISTACPGSFLRKQAHCLLFLDAESASLL